MRGASTDLGGGIHVRQSRAYEMNSVLLLDAAHAVVVDAGILPSEIDDIAAAVKAGRPAAVSLVFTHAHWDHVLARPWFPGARTIAHDRLAGELRRGAADVAAEAKRLAKEHGETWTCGFEPFRPDEAVRGQQFLKLGDWKLVFRDSPGHSASAVTIHVPDRGLLIAGDLLSDVEIPGLDGPPSIYRDTIEALRPLAEGGAIGTIVPGHGSIARGREAVGARFEHDLGYLHAIEQAVRSARDAGLPEEDTVEKLAAMEYTGRVGPYAEMLAAVHAENVAHAWRALAAPGKPRR